MSLPRQMNHQVSPGGRKNVAHLGGDEKRKDATTQIRVLSGHRSRHGLWTKKCTGFERRFNLCPLQQGRRQKQCRSLG